MGDLNLLFWTSTRTPVILQTEVAECGLACMAMVAAHHGKPDVLPDLRSDYSSSRGTSLRTLLAVATGLGLHARPLKTDLEALEELPLPAILHWNLSHFVVLDKVSRSHYTIIDPALGRRRLTRGQLSDSFTGVCLELTPGPDFVSGEGRAATTSLPLLGPVDMLRANVTVIFLLGVVAQLISLSVPYYWQWMLDQALPSDDRALVTTLAAAFTCLLVLQVSMSAVRSWMITAASTRLRFQWFGNVASHMVRLPLDYFAKRSLGDVSSRFGAVEQIQHVLTSRFIESIMDGLLAALVLAVMLIYSPALTALAVVALATYALVRLGTQARIEFATKDSLIQGAKQSSHLFETIRGMQTVRLFGRGAARTAKWMDLLAGQLNKEVQVSRLQLLTQSSNTLMFGIERIFVIAIGVYLVFEGKLSIGMLVAFMGYKERFTESGSRLIDAIFELRLLRVHTERLRDITETQAEARPSPGHFAFDAPRISLEGVSFHHSVDQPPALRNISLAFGYGESVCITGPSGCGKSTLARVLLGLHRPQEGHIDVDGRAVDEVGLERYRELFGAVMQDDVLFAGTIEQNIHFFDSEPDIAWAHECAAMVGMDAEIRQMPMGYRTIVGDLGNGLSGGQKQRLFLARALYKRPRILILDEATSHLDIENERLVNQAIERAAVTRIVIAHRPETIAIADRIIKMENGAVVFDQTVERGERKRDLVHRLVGAATA